MSKILEIIQEVRGNFKVWLLRTLAVLVLLFLFSVAFGGVSQKDKWKIEYIEVSGFQAVSEDDILELTRSLLVGNYYLTYARENSYLFPRFEIERKLLEKFPRLKSVHASRIDDHTIKIVVTERKPFALWCGEVYLREMYETNDCWFIDDTGFIFDRAPVFSEGVYLEIYSELANNKNNEILRARVPGNRFDLVYEVEKSLEKELIKTLRIVIKPEGEYRVVIKSSESYPMIANAELRFKDGMPPLKIVRNLLAALPVQFPVAQAMSIKTEEEKTLHYIDMRFGNKIFFGFEPEGE